MEFLGVIETMANEEQQSPAAPAWQSKQVYTMAAVCLVVGLALGYLFRGSQSPAAAVPAPAQTKAVGNAMPGGMPPGAHPTMPTLEQMKQMADKKAAPLLEKLKTDPNNTDVLNQVGTIYKATHQFKEAIEYFNRALKVDPKNVAIRTDMASCMYYEGDVEGALGQLQQSLHYDPKDANSLFNLGIIKWQGKQDAKGALAAWQELLKANPQLAADKKVAVEKLIADVKMQGKS
jgi:cytochrome c-type biogenesis protein CcmH/NrfG